MKRVNVELVPDLVGERNQEGQVLGGKLVQIGSATVVESSILTILNVVENVVVSLFLIVQASWEEE
jgi:hypothetical protein